MSLCRGACTPHCTSCCEKRAASSNPAPAGKTQAGKSPPGILPVTEKGQGHSMGHRQGHDRQPYVTNVKYSYTGPCNKYPPQRQCSIRQSKPLQHRQGHCKISKNHIENLLRH